MECNIEADEQIGGDEGESNPLSRRLPDQDIYRLS
jgi:hypothetical protein